MNVPILVLLTYANSVFSRRIAQIVFIALTAADATTASCLQICATRATFLETSNLLERSMWRK